MNFGSPEYANSVLSFAHVYGQARAAGMPAPRALSLLRDRVRRAISGYWTHAGALNWDTGLGERTSIEVPGVGADGCTGQRLRFTKLVGHRATLTFAAGQLWVVMRDTGTGYRIDPDGSRMSFNAGHTPAQASVYRGRLYIAARDEHRVLVLDLEPGSNSTRSPSRRTRRRSPVTAARSGSPVWRRTRCPASWRTDRFAERAE